jgi:hypothetical protein
MFVYATAYNVFQHFACYNCKRDGSVVGCTKLVPFLKYWNHICFFPFYAKCWNTLYAVAYTNIFFFEKNKVLGVEPNRVLNILEGI